MTLKILITILLAFLGLARVSFGAPSLNENITTMMNRKPLVGGPNCWNTVLRLTNLLSTVRYSGSNEFDLILNSPECRALKNGEVRTAGDIIAIRNYNDHSFGTEEHAVVYLSKNLAFGKEGPQAGDPYTIRDLNKIFADQSGNTDPNCMMNEGRASGRCTIYTQWYRCDAGLAAEPINTSETLRKTEERVLSFERQIEGLIYTAKKLHPNEVQMQSSEADKIIDSVNNYCQSADKTPAEEATARIFFARLWSISRQLQILDEQTLAVSYYRAAFQVDRVLNECSPK